jgi:HPr kinase/phosphorylase
MKIAVKALLDDAVFNLDLRLLGGAAGLQRSIENARIQKPGLAMAGLVEAIRPGRVQVFGNTEMQYLRGLSTEVKRLALQGLFAAPIPCVVVTTGLRAPLDLLQLAEQHGVATFGTSLTSGTFIGRIHSFLDEHISAEVTLHGVLVDVFGVGVLLAGQSGIGKSECALDLILRGHRLVGDDVVLVRQYDRELVGMGSPLTKHHMEVRGLGIINVKDLFGAASVCERKGVELIVEMLEWQPDGEYDRLGIDENNERILNTLVPKVRLPIRPGRNVASIVEVAARNHLLKLQGHHSARKFQQSVERRLALEARQPQGLLRGLPQGLDDEDSACMNPPGGDP